MRQAVLALLGLAPIVLVGCADVQREDDRANANQTCGHDRTSLLPAMEAAVPADATVHVHVELSGRGQVVEVEAVIAYRPTGADIAMTFRDDEVEFGLIMVDDRLYLSDSAKDGAYAEVDDSDPGATELRRQAESTNLTATFAAWRAGLETVERVGPEEIDGEAICHYSLRVNAAEAAEAQGDPLPAGMPETITYEVYLAADDLMRRVTFEVSGVVAEMNATRWNEPVTIDAPLKVG